MYSGIIFMEINSSFNRNKQISFKAREFAVINTVFKDCGSSFRAYKLEYSDRNFLDSMAFAIKLKKLTESQKFPESVLTLWKKVINNAVLMSSFEEPQTSFLLVNNKKPCAIMNYKDLDNCYLDNIASWPVAKDKHIKFSGLSLLKLLFYNCEKHNTSKIGLDVLRNSNINLKKFYEALGFVENPCRDNFATDMVISREKMLLISKKLDTIMQIKEIENPKKVNLSKTLDIRF